MSAITGLLGGKAKKVSPPPLPSPVPLPQEAQVAQKAEDKRRKLLAAVGYQGTILTGNLLGDTGKINKAQVLGQVV